MSNSPLVFSVQPVAITIGNGSTTATATLGTAVGSGAFILFDGINSTDTTGNYKYSDCALSLTSSTVVTATRNVTSTSVATVYGVVIDAAPSLVSSVQYGTVSIAASSGSGTATITSVNTAYSAVFYLGDYDNATSAGTAKTTAPYVTLTNSTTVTAAINGTSAGMTIGFCVVTFNSAVIKSLQAFTNTSTTSTTTDTQTITSVVPANAIVAYGGSSSAALTPPSGYFYANLASATSVAFTTNTAATTTRTHAATVIEFIAGIVNVQRGTLPITSGSNSITSTITSVDTTISALNFTGWNTGQTSFEGATCNTAGVLTNATTVTGSINTAGSTNTAGFEVITFKGGAITESGSAADTITAANNTSGTVSESGSATDTTASNANFISAVSETGSAADSVATSAIFNSAVSESGSALDTVSAANHPNGAISESGSATDSVSVVANYHGAISESGSAVDTVSGGKLALGNVAETGSAIDTVSVVKIMGASIVEIGNAADTVSDTYVEGKAVFETGNALDSVDAEQLFAIPAVGSQGDMLFRLLTNLPSRWFPAASNATPPLQAAPILAGILSGAAAALSGIYSQIQYVGQQMRIQTATGFNLDLISLDFFGVGGLPRKPGENDNPFRKRILANLLLPKGTRASVYHAIVKLTGVAPTIFEPLNPRDTGGYAPAGSHTWYGLAYNSAGGYGSFAYPYQMFVTATGTQASVNPVASVNGYGGYLSGYGNGTTGNVSAAINSEYANGTLNTGSISNSDIYSAVANTIPAGTIAWVGIVT